MPRPKGASWKQHQIAAMKYLYRATAERWEAEGRQDDRRVFVRTYHMIMDGLLTLQPEPALFIRTAVAEKLRKERALMDRIAAAFEGREFEPREGKRA